MRITVKTTRATSTITANKSSTKATHDQFFRTGIANVRENKAPYASRIVRPRMMKPQNVKKWARPGTVHFNSLRWPATSTSSASTRRAGWSNRSAAG